MDPPEWQRLLERCRHLLASAAPDVPEENLYKLKVTDVALDASIQLGRWEEALQFGLKTLPAYRYRGWGGAFGKKFMTTSHERRQTVACVSGLLLTRVTKVRHSSVLFTKNEQFCISARGQRRLSDVSPKDGVFC